MSGRTKKYQFSEVSQFEQVCIPVGCILVLCPGGLCPGGLCQGGGLFFGGVFLSGGFCKGDPLPRCAQTDTCEIITLTQTSFVGGNYTNEGYLRLPTLARISIH